MNWEDDGQEIFDFARSLYGSPTRIVKNADYYFRKGITWSDVTIGESSFRILPQGFIFDEQATQLSSGTRTPSYNASDLQTQKSLQNLS